MKLRGWSIEGFGLFHDYEVRNLPDGLVVFYGPNEAGKSTLLAFVRGVLFGFPNGASPRRPFPPLRGGRHRGRLFLSVEGGEYAVERDAGNGGRPRVLKPGGEAGDSADLQRLLDGADDDLFRSVFAFSLAELQVFGSLDSETVRERIFSAAIAGAGRSAAGVLHQIDARAAELLGDGEAAAINRLVAELNELRPRRDSARRAALGYAGALAAARRLDREQSELEEALARERSDKRRLELLLDLRPTWSDLAASRRDLESLAAVADVSDESRRRLQSLREALAVARARHGTLRREQEEAQSRRREPRLRDAAALGPRIERVHEDLALHRARLARLSAAERRVDEARRAVEECLRRVGHGWGEAELGRCDVAALSREGLQGWSERRSRLIAEERSADEAVSRASARLEALRREREATAARLSTMTRRDPAELTEQREAVRRLRLRLEEVAAEQVRGEDADRAASERERTTRSLRGEAAAAAPPEWLAALLWLFLAVALAAMVWRGLEADLPGVAALGVAGASAGLAAWAVSQARRSAEARERRRESEFRMLRSALQEARRLRDTHWRRAAELLDGVARDAASLGLPRMPAPEAIEEREREIAGQEAQHARWEVLEAEAQASLEALQRAESELAEASTRRREAGRTLAAWTDEWREHGRRHGLPEGIDVGRAAELGIAAAETQAAARSLAAARAEAVELREEIERWEMRARDLLRLADGEGAPETGGEALIEEVLTLRERHLAGAAQLLALADLEREIEQREHRIREAESEVGTLERERRQILSQLGVADEGEIERRGELVRRRADAERRVEERERQIAELLAGRGDAEEIRAALAADDPVAWRESLAAVEERIRSRERELVDLTTRRHEAERTCRSLEESSEVADLEMEWSAAMADLERAVHDWRVLAVARGLVEETLEEFQRARQPDVLREASRIFATVTGGRYQGIVQDEGGRRLLIVDRDGRRKQVADELSRGTAEQLYLSLRLGLAVDFAKRGVSLPLVMDDVLVNFDPERARGMAAALGEFARHHQVLFFTCHPSTRELLEDVGGAERVIELGS